MAYSLTATTKILVDQTSLNPNLVLKIDGIPEIFGQVGVFKLIRIGDPDLFIDGSWNIGGLIEDEDSRPWISKQKTSKNITQQLLQDKGGSSSISNVNIEIIDYNNELTKILEPGNNLDDVLTASAKVYLGFKQGAFPSDFIEVFSGVVSDLDFGASSAVLTVSHPEQLKRREIFLQAISKTVGAIDDLVTTIPLEATTGLITPSSEVKTYVRLEDELIEYTGILGNSLTGCIRGQLNTIATSHDDETESVSFYELSGKPIETALKIMLSDDAQSDIESDIEIGRVNYIDTINKIDGAYFFNEENIQKRLGLVNGDLFSVSGTLSDFTDEPITGFGVTDSGSYILTASASRPDELTSGGLASIKSKYNVLPAGTGLGLKSNQVDIEGHEFVNTLFGSAFPDYVFFIKDTISGKEFIENQIYHPSGLYSLPRKGKSGVGYTSPPLGVSEIKTLDETNIVKPEKLRIKRSINKWFYNNIVFKFQEDSLEDKFLDNKVTLSSDSVNRLKTGNKSLTIESKGLRSNPITSNLIDRVTRNMLNRYQFASDFVPKVEVMPNTGFNTEVGDVVIFGSDNLGLSDNATGTRQFKPRLMEIVNKSLDVTTMKITLDLLDTSFGVDARFTVISPSSNIALGSTDTIIRLKESYSTASGEGETVKWEDYEKKNIIIRSIDWSFQEIRSFKIHPTIPNALLLDAPLSGAPLENYIVDVATYDETSETNKVLHGFINPTVYVDSATNSTTFEIPLGEEIKFFEDGFIRVHNRNFSNDSGQVKIESIVGQTITCEDLGFTPVNGDEIDLIGFYSDEGLPYAML